MSQKSPVNLAASVRARLTNLARERGIEFQGMLSDFAIERFLYRLGLSTHAEQYILKGAMLFRVWSNDRHRATWDLDLLGRGERGIEDIVAVVREVCSIPAADGIIFDLESIEGEDIRAFDEYAAVRVRFAAHLARARIPMQVDVGFGDAITPEPRREDYPVLLAHPVPRILTYPRETVVAEKLEAMISLGMTNTRMKDFFDVQVLAASFAFDGPTLVSAVRATFERRGTPVPEAQPLVLSREFLAAPERQTQWRAFLRRGRLAGSPDTEALSDALRAFLGPVLVALAENGEAPARWSPGGPWKSIGAA